MFLCAKTKGVARNDIIYYNFNSVVVTTVP